MSEIKGFILSLCAASAASAIAEGFIPGGSIKKYVSYLISLTLLLVLLSPLLSLIAALPSLASALPAYDSVEAIARANGIVAMHIEKALCEKFSLDDSEVECGYDGDVITVSVKKRFGLVASDFETFVLHNYGLYAEVKLYE